MQCNNLKIVYYFTFLSVYYCCYIFYFYICCKSEILFNYYPKKGLKNLKTWLKCIYIVIISGTLLSFMQTWLLSSIIFVLLKNYLFYLFFVAVLLEVDSLSFSLYEKLCISQSLNSACPRVAWTWSLRLEVFPQHFKNSVWCLLDCFLFSEKSEGLIFLSL